MTTESAVTICRWLESRNEGEERLVSVASNGIFHAYKRPAFMSILSQAARPSDTLDELASKLATPEPCIPVSKVREMFRVAIANSERKDDPGRQGLFFVQFNLEEMLNNYKP